ncbi:hypothetical protein D5086_007731 [Populus alba]|uniref:Uncharacterized protein n=1 Tax=Populus alba TaxID=43335 RepID=A0ACC4CEV6_POPAL
MKQESKERPVSSPLRRIAFTEAPLLVLCSVDANALAMKVSAQISSMIAPTLHRFSSSHHLEVVTEENPGSIMKQNSRINTCFVSHPLTAFLDNHYVNYRHLDHRHQNVVK